MVRNNHLPTILVVALVLTSATAAGAVVAVDTNATTPSQSSTTESVTVTVKNVTDGDTINIRYDNGSVDTVRLLGVDTPEVYAENTPSEFEGVPNTEAGKQCLHNAGVNASEYTTAELAGETVTLKFDSKADCRGYYGRLLAYVYDDGQNFNLDLIQTGHARVYDSTFTKRETFYDAENTSQSKLRGLWHCRTIDDGSSGDGNVSGQATIDWDHAEVDSLNDERVKITNTGESALDLSGYTLSDEAGHTYTFPDGFTLSAGASVWVHSGDERCGRPLR